MGKRVAHSGHACGVVVSGLCCEQVRAMEHRQKREMAEEEQRRARQAELDAVQREAAAKARLEEEAFEQQLQAFATCPNKKLVLSQHCVSVLQHLCVRNASATRNHVPALLWCSVSACLYTYVSALCQQFPALLCQHCHNAIVSACLRKIVPALAMQVKIFTRTAMMKGAQSSWVTG